MSQVPDVLPTQNTKEPCNQNQQVIDINNQQTWTHCKERRFSTETNSSNQSKQVNHQTSKQDSSLGQIFNEMRSVCGKGEGGQ